MKEQGTLLIAENKKAFHDYFLEDFLEAGIELFGTEIKALREHAVNIRDSFVLIKKGQAWIVGMNISGYSHGTYTNHEPLRTRRLLLHRREINRLERLVLEKSLTIVPVKVYLKHGMAKIEIALAKGKKEYDKREVERERSIQKEIKHALKKGSRDE